MARSMLAAAGPGRPAHNAWRPLKSADFTVALAAPVLGKSPHFIVHHLAARPGSAVASKSRQFVPDLSTEVAPNGSPNVDNTEKPLAWWLGLVVPKRYARRSVTRNLLKRQMRVQANRHHDRLPAGQWIIRLRAPFDPKRFRSAASSQLRDAARQELERIFAAVVTP